MHVPPSERPPTTDRAASHAASFHADTVARVRGTIGSHDVVVLGMGWNPHVKKARAALDEASIPYEYVEIGNYSSQWKERLAIKLWSGWPTFPQVFVKGTLIGGNTELRASLEDGTVRALLDG